MAPTPPVDTFLAAAENAFERCPRVSGLRLIGVRVEQGVLNVQFEGPADDFRGPFGARLALPVDDVDGGPDTGSRETFQDGLQRLIASRLTEAYHASRNRQRPYTRDGVWWLIDDTVDL